MLPDYFEFRLPTKVIYGIGILGNVAPAVSLLGRRRAVLVTDGNLTGPGGAVQSVKSGFSQTDIQIVYVFDKVPPNSSIATVEACAEMAREHKCDMIIAAGGGSVMDTAKCVNLLLVKQGRLKDHMGAFLLDPGQSLLPSIFIPTTAGTGSEVTRMAVVCDPDKGAKLTFIEEQFLPDITILDPKVTISMPPVLTAVTGMDALTHAIEAYVNKQWSPASDALALHAIRLLSANILNACARPDDLEARGAMLTGSFLAGLALSHAMPGMAHAIANAVSGAHPIAHGLVSALVIPEVMAYNLDAVPERFAEIAVAMGVSFPQIVDQSRNLIKSSRLAFLKNAFTPLDEVRDWLSAHSHKARGVASKALGNLAFIDRWFRKQMAWAGIDKINTLNRRLAYLTGMPLNLKDAGIGDDPALLKRIADAAMDAASMLHSPVASDRQAVVEIIRRVHESKATPQQMDDEDLEAEPVPPKDPELRGVFRDTEMLYSVLFGFFNRLKKDPETSEPFKNTGICLQFQFENPDGTITMDASGKTLKLVKGEFNGTPEIILYMDGDFAHKFWHGRVNLVTALAMRQVRAKGNIPKALRLLPVLKPAFKIYPQYLAETGHVRLIIT